MRFVPAVLVLHPRSAHCFESNIRFKHFRIKQQKSLITCNVSNTAELLIIRYYVVRCYETILIRPPDTRRTAL